jgi:DNA end-binding protein Ku
MPDRPSWKGYLKLSLVTCPVNMSSVTSESEKVRFRTLNRTTGNPVVSQLVDSVTRKPVEADDEVKGYEHAEGQFVILEDDELQSVALESARTINIELFTPLKDIDWIWYDQPNYLTPSDKVGAEAFAVVREAMSSTGMAGIAHLVMYRRERPVMLVPNGKGIVLWTLRYGDEVRDDADFTGDVSNDKSDPEMVVLFNSLIDQKTRNWNESLVSDPVQEKLLQIVAAKKKGQRPKAKLEPDKQPSGNVINIMDALRNSLREGKGV